MFLNDTKIRYRTNVPWLFAWNWWRSRSSFIVGGSKVDSIVVGHPSTQTKRTQTQPTERQNDQSCAKWMNFEFVKPPYQNHNTHKHTKWVFIVYRSRRVATRKWQVDNSDMFELFAFMQACYRGLLPLERSTWICCAFIFCLPSFRINTLEPGSIIIDQYPTPYHFADVETDIFRVISLDLSASIRSKRNETSERIFLRFVKLFLLLPTNTTTICRVGLENCCLH